MLLILNSLVLTTITTLSLFINALKLHLNINETFTISVLISWKRKHSVSTVMFTYREQLGHVAGGYDSILLGLWCQRVYVTRRLNE